jgi:ubiquinone/menaquinone biosynthesis C-methylase UbiE
MAQPDHSQKAHFSDRFDRSAATYEAVDVDFFEPLAAALVKRAGLAPGMHVLDLGTGSGAALRAAAAAVGEWLPMARSPSCSGYASPAPSPRKRNLRSSAATC